MMGDEHVSNDKAPANMHGVLLPPTQCLPTTPAAQPPAVRDTAAPWMASPAPCVQSPAAHSGGIEKALISSCARMLGHWQRW